MKKIKIVISGLTLSFLSACASAPFEQAKPAVIIPSPETTKQLTKIMTDALNGKKVSLNKDAFTHSHIHTLQQKPATTRDGQLIDGRILTLPSSNRFALFSRGNTCYLIHEKTNKQYPLSGIQCKAL